MIATQLEKKPYLPAFILMGHGVVAVDKDILIAEHNAELVEETATITVLSALSGIRGEMKSLGNRTGL